jgi:chromosome segregation ATPase
LRRFALLIAAIVLCLPCNLLAQRSGGGHGGHGAPTGGGPSGAKGPGSQTDPDLLNNLHRAMAVQAFGDQPARFQSLAKSTENAKQETEALQQQASKPDSSIDYSPKATALARAIDEAQANNHDFLKSLSDSQRAELKDPVKKLEKADSDVTKEWKTLGQQLKRTKADDKRIADAAAKLAQALGKLHSEQLAIGAEMGLQRPS